MRMRLQSPTGDFVFGQSSQDYLVNSQAMMAQALICALSLTQGTMFTNTQAGVPWLTQVVGGFPLKAIYDQIVQDAILGVEGVIGPLISYSSTLSEDRALTIDHVVVGTLYGEVELTGVTLTN